MLVLGLLGETLVQANVRLACDWPSTTCLEFKEIHSLWLPLLGLDVLRKDLSLYFNVCLYILHNILIKNTVHGQSPRPGREVVIQITKVLSNIYFFR